MALVCVLEGAVEFLEGGRIRSDVHRDGQFVHLRSLDVAHEVHDRQEAGNVELALHAIGEDFEIS